LGRPEAGASPGPAVVVGYPVFKAEGKSLDSKNQVRTTRVSHADTHSSECGTPARSATASDVRSVTVTYDPTCPFCAVAKKSPQQEELEELQ